MRSSSSRGWVVTVLALLLLLWEPLTFAWRASASLSRLSQYGPPAFALLAFRALVVGVGMAAGRALLAGERHGLILSHAFFGLSALAALWTYVTPYFPAAAAPSEAPWRLAALLFYNAAWSLYLSRSHRVRAHFSR